MGNWRSKRGTDASAAQQTVPRRKRHKVVEEERKEELVSSAPASPSHSPSSSPSPDLSSSTLRQRHTSTAQTDGGGVVVASRKYFHRQEVIDSDDSDDTTPPIPPSPTAPPPPPAHQHQRCAWLRRRHFLLFSLATLCFTHFVTTNTPAAGYLSELPEQIAALLPDELHSQLSRFQTLMGDVTRPGIAARDDGIHAHYPVILIPGIITTALEVWEGEACARPHFRQRLWGSTLMLRSILLDTRCWMRHMMLDPHTGMDPPGIKLRSSTGMEAADYLVSGFWVWAKVIENLADIGYDSNSMSMAPYDWRLSFKHLQVRDFYFSKLKAEIELARLSNHNRRVVLVTHSMGALVVHYFMQWVESEQGGGAGDRWVDQHIGSIVNIGGPMLGVPKAWSALFSGEMKDTAELAPFLDYWRQRVVFSQADVIQMMRALFSVPSMLPKGGDVIWGTRDGAPDDYFCKRYAAVTKLLMAGAQGLADIDDELAQQYCSIIPELRRNATNASTPLPTTLLGSSFAAFDPTSASAPVAVPASSGASAGIADTEVDAAEQYVDGKLQPNPNSAGGVTSSLSAMLEDSILAHPSRWFASHKEQQPYNSTRGSPRGLFVTFTSSHSADEPQEQCVDGVGMGCDLTMDESMALLRRSAPEYTTFVESLYSLGSDARANRSEQRHWSNPLESPLPYAPDLKVYCFYGVGRETERGYMYKHVPTAPTTSGSGGGASSAGGENSVVPHWAINSSHTDLRRNVHSGVKFTDGDGTVPLISLGFMCSAGWKGTPLNPANAAVITREYLEVNATMAILRAATSTDHVDIMGNSNVIADLLKIVGVRRRGAASGVGEGRREEEEKERARQERRRVLEAENEGRRAEEKGPKTEEQRRAESPPDKRAEKGEAESDSKAGSGGGKPAEEAAEVYGEHDAAEWVETYHEVKDRVLSCVREVSAEAERRLLNKLGVAEWKAAAKAAQTAQQSSTQNPYTEKAPEVRVRESELAGSGGAVAETGSS